jgi:hypothetical protein
MRRVRHGWVFGWLLAPLALAAGAALAVESGIDPRPDAGARSAELRQRSHLEDLPPRPADAVDRFHGEFGLWVDEVGDSVHVRWLTSDEVGGHLLASADGRVLVEGHTPAGRGHHVVLARPRGTQVELEYGSAADLHRTTIRLDTGRRRPPPAISRVDSIFVASDLHGEFDRFIALLRNAGLVDNSLRWTGGRAHLVVAGDVFDRGPDVVPILWLLYRLEQEAAASNGGAHLILGNHEIMVMLNDLRYVGAKELAVAELHGVPYWRLFDSRHSILGRWLASRPALLRIDRALIAHGGVSDDYLPYTLQSFSDTLRAYIEHDLFRRWNDEVGDTVRIQADRYDRWLDFFWGERSVFWYRDYVLQDDLGQSLARVLNRMRADVHVVGHTPVAIVGERYDGALIAVNPAELGTEMVLLVRTRDGYRRFRYGLEGQPEAF